MSDNEWNGVCLITRTSIEQAGCHRTQGQPECFNCLSKHKVCLRCKTGKVHAVNVSLCRNCYVHELIMGRAEGNTVFHDLREKALTNPVGDPDLGRKGGGRPTRYHRGDMEYERSVTFLYNVGATSIPTSSWFHSGPKKDKCRTAREVAERLDRLIATSPVPVARRAKIHARMCCFILSSIGYTDEEVALHFGIELEYLKLLVRQTLTWIYRAQDGVGIEELGNKTPSTVLHALIRRFYWRGDIYKRWSQIT